MRHDPAELELYLHTHIPITGAMEVAVLSADARGVALRAPLPPNINHRSTVFGGSASTLAILAAWTLLHLLLREQGVAAQIVIQRSTVEYLRPMRGDFEARSPAPPAEEWRRFLAALRRRGRARLSLEAELWSEGVPAGAFRGEYVAIAVAAG